ncbi:MAG: histidine phosphatase family protein [Pseudomonadota bacterium]
MSFRSPFLRLFFLPLILLFALGTAWGGGLDIYFVRHAQTVANASGQHNKQSSGSFSEDGERQIAELTETLRDLHFDAILVSPTERTLYTILPYLKQQQLTAAIWPELTECCWQEDRQATGGLLQKGKAIILEADAAPYFNFRNAASAMHYSNRSYADGVAQVEEAYRLLRSDYFSSGKTILIVAHYHSGGLLLSKLLGIPREALPGPENAKLTHLRQDADGKFRLLMLNGLPH